MLHVCCWNQFSSSKPFLILLYIFIIMAWGSFFAVFWGKIQTRHEQKRKTNPSLSSLTLCNRVNKTWEEIRWDLRGFLWNQFNSLMFSVCVVWIYSTYAYDSHNNNEKTWLAFWLHMAHGNFFLTSFFGHDPWFIKKFIFFGQLNYLNLFG